MFRNNQFQCKTDRCRHTSLGGLPRLVSTTGFLHIGTITGGRRNAKTVLNTDDSLSFRDTRPWLRPEPRHPGEQLLLFRVHLANGAPARGFPVLICVDVGIPKWPAVSASGSGRELVCRPFPALLSMTGREVHMTYLILPIVHIHTCTRPSLSRFLCLSLDRHPAPAN